MYIGLTLFAIRFTTRQEPRVNVNCKENINHNKISITFFKVEEQFKKCLKAKELEILILMLIIKNTNIIAFKVKHEIKNNLATRINRSRTK